MNLIDKAFALCSEIESRQHELRTLLEQIAASEAAKNNLQSTPTAEEVTIIASPREAVAESVISVVESAPMQEPEASAKTTGGDIRKAFTINDRFRFRRELFGGDDSAMQRVIAHLAELPDFAAAEQYISSLGWDRDSEAVGEFIGIVHTHFNGYHL